MSLPPDFAERMRQQLGEAEFKQFSDALETERVTSLRLNPKKTNESFNEEESVPWFTEGKYLSERPSFAKDPLIFAGTYYVQEASSMFLGHAIKQALGTSQPLQALDLCAAPGGKSTLINSMLSDDSLLVSNELVSKRVIPLKENLVRWGNANVLVTSNNSADFKPLQSFFDLVVVDAPCSGEGMFRKDPKAMQLWSENLVTTCAIQQKQILEDIAPTLKEGGILIYSTCTFAPAENEENIAFLAEQGGFEPIQLEVPSEWGITQKEVEQNGQTYYGYQFFPHKTKGEGFFLTCFRKVAGGKASKVKSKHRVKVELLPKKFIPQIAKWLKSADDFEFVLQNEILHAVPKSIAKEYKFLVNHLKIKQYGVELGKFAGKKLIPTHHFAMSHLVSAKIPRVELPYAQAINYLRKQDVEVETASTGWAIATYQGHALGWMKVLPNRINNYYPMELRLRKEFDVESD